MARWLHHDCHVAVDEAKAQRVIERLSEHLNVSSG
jgi:hypothetical protein